MKTFRSAVKRWTLLLVLALMVFSSAPTVSSQEEGVNPFGYPSGQAVLNETFDAATTPAGWSVVNNVGSVGWCFDNPGGRTNNTGGSGNFAIADSDQAGYVDMDTELRTPALNLSGAANVSLKFNTYFRAYDNSTADVDVSTNGGATWTNVWRKTGADFKGTATVDLSAQAANQSNVMVRFRYYSANYDWWWQVDDVQVETLTAPAAPTNLNATATTYDIGLSWTDNSNETNFKIERSPDGSSGWTQIGSVGADVTTYTDSNLNCNTTYYYRVFATNGSLTSGYSNTANATTAACAAATSVSEDFAATTTPAGWTVVNNVGSVGWLFNNPGSRPNGTGGSGNFATADQYDAGCSTSMDTELRTPVVNLAGQSAVQLTFNTQFWKYWGTNTVADVDVSKDGGATWTNVWRKTASFQGPVTLDLSALAADQSNVMVRFRYSTSYCDYWWQIDDVVLAALTAAPAAPTNLNATLAANNDVNLSWTWTDTGAPGFKVERSDGGGWAQIADVTNGATTYVDSGVSGGATYSYRVRAYNGAGTSGYSNTANVTTGSSSVSTYDVTISYYDTAANTAAKKPYLENIIRYFADAVYEMSNGTNKLRRVTIYTDGAMANQADVLWSAGTGCRANANPAGYGKTGQHIRTCDPSYLSQDLHQQIHGYTLGHEWGHYFHGLYDEYVEQGEPCGGARHMPCQNDTAVQKSIMHLQACAVNAPWIYPGVCQANGDLNWLNFSTPLNNTRNTAQHRMYGASGWETLARHPSQDPHHPAYVYAPTRLYHPEVAAAAPASGQWPSIELPAGQTAARSELQIVWAGGSGGLASEEGVYALAATSGVVRQIVIDSSDSMTTTGQLEEVKSAVSTLVDQAEIGDTIGLINFDGTVTVAHVLTEITGQAAKDALIASVDGITIGGSDAAPGDALQTALDGLTATGVPTNTNRTVYLITTGQNTTGAYPLSVTPSYQENFVTLHTFGYRAEEDAVTTLRQMAEQTGGAYSSVNSSNALLDALKSADQVTSPSVDVNVKTNWGWVQAWTSAQEQFVVDSTLGDMRIEVAYFSGTPLSAALTLYDPNYSSTVLTDCEVWSEGMYPLTLCFLTQSNPLAGTWTLNIYATEDIFLLYWVGGSAKDDTFTFDAVVDSATGDVVEYPEPIVVGATVGKDYPITGAGLESILQAPDGTTQSFTMRDDGVAPDDIAGDGVYAAFLDYQADGDYYITVQFNNNAGTAMFTGEGLMWDKGDGTIEPPDPWPVEENFERFAQTQVSVTGWQWDDHSNWYDYTEWLPTDLQTDNTAVAGRIDYLYDVDVFKVTVPADYSGTLGLRIDNLGLDMDPYLYIFAEDWSWGFDAYLEFVPTSDDFLFVPLSVNPGETFYVGVWHYNYSTATTGFYNISVGSWLSSDPTGQTKVEYYNYLPTILKASGSE